MVNTSSLLIIGGIAVAAGLYFTNTLCGKFNTGQALCFNGFGNAAGSGPVQQKSNALIPPGPGDQSFSSCLCQGGKYVGTCPQAGQGCSNAAVAYAYSGYRSAPLSIA